MSVINFQMPREVFSENVDDFHGIFIFEPLEKGYGVTLGNALRRVLLSSLQGYAITSIKIPGVQHEFSTIEGVIEDVSEMVLNLKKIRFKEIADIEEDKVLIPIKNRTVFKAGDLVKNISSFEVLNPDLVICYLDKKANFELELTIEKGRGYVPAEENKPTSQIIGLIPMDAIFTPIRNVKYHVENKRVGQKTDYEKLIIEVQTDGSIHPKVAMKNAADILIRHFILLSDNDTTLELANSTDKMMMDEETLRVRKLLKTSLMNLNLSVRASNCLKVAGIKILADLVKLDVAEMSKFRNLGKKSLKELQDLVVEKNLTFGLDLTKYKLDKDL